MNLSRAKSPGRPRRIALRLPLVAVPLLLAASVLAPTTATQPAGPAAGRLTGPAAAAGQLPAPAQAPAPAHTSAKPAPTPAHPHRAAPRQVTVTFRTVPAVPGVRLVFGGRAMTTDAAGRAACTAPRTSAPQTLALRDTTLDTGRRHYRFARWTGQRDPDQAYRPVVHGLPLRADYTVTAAFAVAYPVIARFTDQHGTALDTTRITEATVKSSTGRLLGLRTHGTTWLDGAVPVYRGSRVELTPVTYGLQSLLYDRAQLADAGRQRFSPASGRTVTFAGPFHDLTITAHDAVFGGRTGRRAEVTGPDGTRHTVRFGANGTAVVTHLPRGRYRVAVRVHGGLVSVQEFRLSRSRTVDAAVITRLDFFVAGASLLLMAGGVVLIRRVRAARGRRPADPPEPPGLPEPEEAARSGTASPAGTGAP
ncbi:hypothetical protein [Streptomyces sp. NPDC047000]|uniref:hypothetical protein n=1 Tax=Streptomyces sp. NPDC047000 TaxID=3155474 RepID=UPI0033F6C69B